MIDSEKDYKEDENRHDNIFSDDNEVIEIKKTKMFNA